MDVYRAMGGSERMRIWAVKCLRKGFTFGVVADLILSIAQDRGDRRLRTIIPRVRRAVHSPWISKQVREELRECDRPGFHPNDIDMTALIEEWRERLFGENGELNGPTLERIAWHFGEEVAAILHDYGTSGDTLWSRFNSGADDIL